MKKSLYGQCEKYARLAVRRDPTLRLVRGFYYCPGTDRTYTHWWTVRSDGTIYDPTKEQFVSNGCGTYEEFDGYIFCECCGKRVHESEMYNAGSHVYCSYDCFGKSVL
jgi:hypothetical protein